MEDTDFNAKLRNLILEAFASGETVDGVWTLESVPDEIPDWQITIERVQENIVEQATEQTDEQIV